MSDLQLNVVIREERPADAGVVYRLNEVAFETNAEARLVDALRVGGGLQLSLVAEVEGEVVGHIAFSQVTLTSGTVSLMGVGLVPLAVLPRYQRRGIGGTLVARGLQRLRDDGELFCVVVGHATYYPRHGFQQARPLGIRWEVPVPDDVFMIQELSHGSLQGVSGTVRYRREFDEID